MKDDFSDRQRQRDEARLRANRSERTFREQQSARRDDMFRKSVNINRLTGEIGLQAGGNAPSRSKQRADLYEEWDRTVASAVGRIADCSWIEQATKDRWCESLKYLFVYSPDAKLRLDALRREVNAWKPSSSDEVMTSGLFATPPPTRVDLSLLSPEGVRAFQMKEAAEQKVEAEEQMKLTLQRADWVLVDLNVDRLLHMYDEYQSL